MKVEDTTPTEPRYPNTPEEVRYVQNIVRSLGPITLADIVDPRGRPVVIEFGTKVDLYEDLKRWSIKKDDIRRSDSLRSAIETEALGVLTEEQYRATEFMHPALPPVPEYIAEGDKKDPHNRDVVHPVSPNEYDMGIALSYVEEQEEIDASKARQAGVSRISSEDVQEYVKKRDAGREKKGIRVER